VRKPAPGVTYFEIDDRATLKWKRTCYEIHGIEADVEFIPGNYVTDGLIDLLEEDNFDFNLQTALQHSTEVNRDFITLCSYPRREGLAVAGLVARNFRPTSFPGRAAL
jgi:hypothetical protein